MSTLLVLLYVSAGVAAAWEARRKGYNDMIFMVLGILLGPLLLLVMLFISPKALQVGQPVRPAGVIRLDDGRTIKPSHVTVVRDVSTSDGEIICLITGPDGGKHWVAQEALSAVSKPGEGPIGRILGR